MAQRTRTGKESRILDIGNACVLTDDSDFIDGWLVGWLNFFDTRYRPPFPLSSETICCYLMDYINCQDKPQSWRMGALVGWIEALAENSQEVLTSILACDHLSIVQRGDA